MPKGKKSCPKCGQENGARAKECGNVQCKEKFKFTIRIKKVKLKTEEVNWRKLQKGDTILVTKGPYYVKRDPRNGVELERKPFGYNGKFKVYEILTDGICAYPTGKTKESGHCFIICVHKEKTKLGLKNLINRPHKIFKIKDRENASEKNTATAATRTRRGRNKVKSKRS